VKTSSVDQVILEVLNIRSCHCTSQELYNLIKSRLPAVNQSTVYRSLERLVNQGKVSVSDIGIGALVYELVGKGLHHHLVCQECHGIFDLSNDEVAVFFNRVEAVSQFQITTNHLILYGICPDCLKRN
jgi:Fur family ferric uptake transcriptional regulator